MNVRTQNKKIKLSIFENVFLSMLRAIKKTDFVYFYVYILLLSSQIVILLTLSNLTID